MIMPDPPLKTVKPSEKSVLVMVPLVYPLLFVKDIKTKLVAFMEQMEFVDGYLKMEQILQNAFYLKNANKQPVQITLLVSYFPVHVINISIHNVLLYQNALVMARCVSLLANVRVILLNRLVPILALMANVSGKSKKLLANVD